MTGGSRIEARPGQCGGPGSFPRRFQGLGRARRPAAPGDTYFASNARPLLLSRDPMPMMTAKTMVPRNVITEALLAVRAAATVAVQRTAVQLHRRTNA
jgi:hypothetical protein